MSFDFLATKNQPDLVYRSAPHMDSLVFCDLHTALCLDQLHTALRAKTWAEFEYLMPADELMYIIQETQTAFDECHDEEKFTLPAPSEEFVLETFCPHHLSGDYPQWLQKDQELWVPKDILERYGRIEDTSFNGEFWLIEEQNELEIIQELTGRGTEVEKREDLYFY